MPLRPYDCRLLSCTTDSVSVAAGAGALRAAKPRWLRPFGKAADTAEQNQSVTLAVTVTVQTPLESWASGYGLSGAEAAAGADPDGDGWSTAQEYAFGLEPNVPGGEPVQVPPEGGKITYLQRSGVAYLVRSATDLGSGFDGTVEPVRSSPQPGGLPLGYEQWEATMPEGSRGFLKVEATIAP